MAQPTTAAEEVNIDLSQGRRQQQRPPQRRFVRFASSSSSSSFDSPFSEVVGHVIPLSEQSDADAASQWWQKRDFDYFKNTARMIGSECRRGGYGRLLENAFDPSVKKRRGSAEAATLPTMAEVKEGKNAVGEAFLRVWATGGHSRRGLERWSNETHGKARRAAESRRCAAVLREQQFIRSKGYDATCEPAVLRIAKVSARYSEGGRRFARAMGEADRFAVDAQRETKKCHAEGKANLKLFQPMTEEKKPERDRAKSMLVGGQAMSHLEEEMTMPSTRLPGKCLDRHSQHFKINVALR